MPPDDTASKPPVKPTRKQAAVDRRAAALRANLLKRKQQARERAEGKAKPGADDR